MPKHSSKIKKTKNHFLCPPCQTVLQPSLLFSHKDHIHQLIQLQQILPQVKQARKIKKQIATLLPKQVVKINTSVSQLQNQIEQKLKQWKKTIGAKIEMLKNFSSQKKHENIHQQTISYIKVDMLNKFVKDSGINLKNQRQIKLDLIMNTQGFVNDLNFALQKNTYLTFQSEQLDSKNKVLHWFEWGKKRLFLYDIMRQTTKLIELQISFKIPSFSRSILMRDNKIYLMGGQQPQYFAHKQLFVFDTESQQPKLKALTNMPYKKFDFTICSLQDSIYVLGGKNNASQIVKTCQRYDIKQNKWFHINTLKKKRYAASAIGCLNKKIYIFGGVQTNGAFVHVIEEYDYRTDSWQILTVKQNHIWKPVQVPAVIEICRNKVLIFGGSDDKVKMTKNTYVFDLSDFSFIRKQDLKKSQVFVTRPFLFGKFVYTVGNEYYMKNRSLHRFNIQSQQWQIIF